MIPRVAMLRPLLLITLILKVVARPDMNDVDSVQTESGDSNGDTDSLASNKPRDPNLINPQPREGYGAEQSNLLWPKDPTTTLPPTKTLTPQPSRQTIGQQSLRALMEFGLIVGVAGMVVILFLALVGAELLYDKLCDQVNALLKKPKTVPDIERLHPAELVGTFSRYK